MPKFRKKPVVIDAVQFNGHNFFEIAAFIGHGDDVMNNLELKSTDLPIIETLEGNMQVSIADWVIKGVKEEFYGFAPKLLKR